MPQGPTPPITVAGFSGMNNVKKQENFFSAEGIAEPRIILNADVSHNNGLVARTGRRKVVDLPGVHSGWGGRSCMLCVANDVLYKVEQGVAIPIMSVGNRGESIDYLELEGKVYFSNRYCQGVFNPVSNTVSEWGVQPPVAPMLLSVDGELLPGTYHVTMTREVEGETSGAGLIVPITLTTQGGIRILNRPVDAVVWCTDVNEYIPYRIGPVDIIQVIPTVEPCLTLMCTPPPYMSNICYAFGLIWGSNGSNLYYGKPYEHRNLFSITQQKFAYNSDITIIAKVPTGLFIGMKTRTIFLMGTEPTHMREIDAGAGSVTGTLAYANNVPELGDILGTPEKGYVDVPIWVTTEGYVIGNASGRLYNLTKNKLVYGIPERGASLYRNLDGVFQFLSSFKAGATGSGAGFSDTATCEVFRNGRLVTT